MCIILYWTEENLKFKNTNKIKLDEIEIEEMAN